MKPTANAAMTVVSAWAAARGGIGGRAGGRPGSGAEAREVLVQPAGVGGAHRRRVAVAVLVVARAGTAPPPARQGDRQRREGREDRGDRDEVGGQLEAVVLGRGQDRRAVAGDELGLDLLLRHPFGDHALDLLALLLGARGLGDVQRHAADVAHDLVLEVVERRARLGGGRRGGRGGEREECDEAEQAGEAGHAAGTPARSSAASMNCWSICPRESATTLPVRSMTKVSGSCEVPYFGASFSRSSRTFGHVDFCCLTNAWEASGASLYVTPKTVPLCVFSRRFWTFSRTGASALHGSHHDAQKFSTTTLPPRSASPVVPPPARFGSRTATPGAAGFLPALTAWSSESFVFLPTTP